MLMQRCTVKRMIVFLTATIGVAGSAAACVPEQGRGSAQGVGEGYEEMTGNTARPGWVAIKEEFDTAMAANTIEALELFIARHPDSPWTAEAKLQLDELRRG